MSAKSFFVDILYCIIFEMARNHLL